MNDDDLAAIAGLPAHTVIRLRRDLDCAKEKLQARDVSLSIMLDISTTALAVQGINSESQRKQRMALFHIHKMINRILSGQEGTGNVEP